MKVFKVICERDGATTKEQGRTSTELVREEFRYAAEDMQQVWDTTEWLREDPEREMLAIFEEAPAITVLPANVGTEGRGAPLPEAKNQG